MKVPLHANVRSLRPAQTPEQLSAVRGIFRDYQASLAIDLCFQGFDEELRNLPGDYVAPSGGLLLATVGGQPAGAAHFAHWPTATIWTLVR